MRFDPFHRFFEMIGAHVIVIPTIQGFTNQFLTDLKGLFRLADRCLRSPIKREFLFHYFTNGEEWCGNSGYSSDEAINSLSKYCVVIW
jgi:hypothetical protein